MRYQSCRLRTDGLEENMLFFTRTISVYKWGKGPISQQGNRLKAFYSSSFLSPFDPTAAGNGGSKAIPAPPTKPIAAIKGRERVIQYPDSLAEPINRMEVQSTPSLRLPNLVSSGPSSSTVGASHPADSNSSISLPFQPMLPTGTYEPPNRSERITSRIPGWYRDRTKEVDMEPSASLRPAREERSSSSRSP